MELTIVTKNGNGKPIESNVGIQVTDDTVLEMIEKRKALPRLPEMALLEVEVEQLDDAKFYFDSNEINSNLAIDLLLGTQGWRRFINQSLSKFVTGNVIADIKTERALGIHKAKVIIIFFLYLFQNNKYFY